MAEQNTEILARGVVRYSNEQAKKITMECIETAFIQLSGEKDPDKITISEIVKRAGVSRTAFYAHYRTKEDVLKSALGTTIDRIMELFPGDPHEESYWLPLLQEIQKIAGPFQLLLKIGLGDQILSEITERCIPADASDESRYYEIFCLGAVYNVLVNWLKNDAEKTPEEIAAVCSGFRRFYEEC